MDRIVFYHHHLPHAFVHHIPTIPPHHHTRIALSLFITLLHIPLVLVPHTLRRTTSYHTMHIYVHAQTSYLVLNNIWGFLEFCCRLNEHAHLEGIRIGLATGETQ
jgi:hypothetical protein